MCWIFNFGSVYGFDFSSINTFFKEQVVKSTLAWASAYEAIKDKAQKAIDDYVAKVKALEQ